MARSIAFYNGSEGGRSSNSRNSFVLLNGQMSGRMGQGSRGSLTVVSRRALPEQNSRSDAQFVPASVLLSNAMLARNAAASVARNHSTTDTHPSTAQNPNPTATDGQSHSFQMLASRLDPLPHDFFQDPNANYELGTEPVQPNSLFQHPFFASLTSPYLEQIKKKHVYELWCLHCGSKVCMRAMKAILLANVRVELFSTDTPPATVNLAFDDYVTCNCSCKIRDVACTGCGNILGYHVTQPCSKCLDSKNNGHFWMYYAETVRCKYRLNPKNSQSVLWGNIDALESEIASSIQTNCYERNHR